MKRKTLLVFATLLLACAREGVQPVEVGFRTFDCFTVSVDDSPMTKVHMEQGGVIKWDEWDNIRVFSDVQDPELFYYQEGKIYPFDEPVSGHQFYAYYPSYNLPPIFNPEERYNLSFLEVTPCASINNSMPQMPMVAIMGEEGVLRFKQTMGLLRFSFKGEYTIRGATLRGNNGEYISGPGTVSLEEEQPSFHLDMKKATKYSSFMPVNPCEIHQDEVLELYFPVPPMTFSRGFELTVILLENGVERKLSKKSNHEVSIPRAVMKCFSVVDVEDLIEENDASIKMEREALVALYNALDGPNWTNNTNWCSDKPVSEWAGITIDDMMHVSTIDLHNNGLKGELPPEIGAFPSLLFLDLTHNSIFGHIPKEISMLKNLREFRAGYNTFTGGIPEELYDMDLLRVIELCNNPHLGGNISSQIEKLKSLERADLSACGLSGGLPEGIARLSELKGFVSSLNPLYGKVPSCFKEWHLWNKIWGDVVGWTNLDISDAMPFCPDFQVTLSDGTTMTSEVIKNNKATLLFHWDHYSSMALSYILTAYDAFKDRGFGIIGYNGSSEELTQMEAYFDRTWPNFFTGIDNTIGNTLYVYPSNGPGPTLCSFDNTGQLVYTNINVYPCGGGVDGFYDYVAATFDPSWTGSEEVYESTDYDRDGKVSMLQQASKGAGINIVLMGDAFSDRLIKDGSYEASMQRVADAFFSEEPFKSYRDFFNVYMVEVVSKNEIYFDGSETALSCFSEINTTKICGNDQAVMEYAHHAIPAEIEADCVVVVLSRLPGSRGTCYMYANGDPADDWEQGLTIAYCSDSFLSLNYIVTHEAGGHGFAKLADEYRSKEGPMPAGEMASYINMTQYGWWRNVDFTDDPAVVKWASFLTDSRYHSEYLGVYEGGAAYEKGVYRPSSASVMSSNGDSFNAPSRYAIWYRINKLAYGADWNGTYEDFVTWDLAHRTPTTKSARPINYVEKDFPPLPPPVVVNKDWREVVNRGR